MPAPRKGEKQADYISRAIPQIINDGTAKDQKQAAAIAYSMWDEHHKNRRHLTTEAIMSNSDTELQASDVELEVEDDESESMQSSDVELQDSDVELDEDGDGYMNAGDIGGFDPDEDDDDDEDEDEFQIEDESGGENPQGGEDGTLPPIEEGRDPARGTLSTPPQVPALVSLRSNNISGLTSPNRPTVDRENNTIRNVSVMQTGPAKGHGFTIDGKMLRQVADQMQGGKAMRFTHPQKMSPDGDMMPTDPLGTHVGRVKNVRLSDDGSELRGDMEFGPHAKHVPLYGNVQDYLMDLADSDPESFGLSTVFKPGDYERDPRTGVPLGRSADVVACDLTGDPASNRRGLC